MVYTWVNEDGYEVSVERAIKDINVPPMVDEDDGQPGPWTRIISKNPAYSSPIQGNKGNWGRV
jgi:hypothetical protein